MEKTNCSRRSFLGKMVKGTGVATVGVLTVGVLSSKVSNARPSDPEQDPNYYIDLDECTACGTCYIAAEVCPSAAWHVPGDETGYPFAWVSTDCTGCGTCIDETEQGDICPVEAIHLPSFGKNLVPSW